jgi:hypothetical protein
MPFPGRSSSVLRTRCRRRGAPRVLGVLSDGSASCMGEDVYVRVDALQSWIESIAGTASQDSDCGTITAEGRCFYGSAVWCRGTQLAATPCGATMQCGWDSAQGGFRCVDPSADPCDGVDAIGACRNGAAMDCNGGVLRKKECGACGACKAEGQTGAPYCTASP